LGDTVFDKAVLPHLIDEYIRTGLPVIGVEFVEPKSASKYGIVEGRIEGNIIHVSNMVEKPQNPPTNIAITGPYVLTAEIFDYLRATRPGVKGEVQLTDALNMYPRKIGYFIKAKRYDIGDVESWLKANIELASAFNNSPTHKGGSTQLD
ncbi:MAG: sugar phosphate nucleotidyltransferase, partial [Thermoprotei archaeon]